MEKPDFHGHSPQSSSSLGASARTKGLTPVTSSSEPHSAQGINSPSTVSSPRFIVPPHTGHSGITHFLLKNFLHAVMAGRAAAIQITNARKRRAQGYDPSVRARPWPGALTQDSAPRARWQVPQACPWVSTYRQEKTRQSIQFMPSYLKHDTESA